MRRLAVMIALVGAGLFSTVPLHGADANPPPDPPRFIFVIEKSETTRPLASEVTQTLFDLVYRGANGHLPDGGVFEIWTFGAETAFRGFVPEMLTPANRLKLASSAAAYVRGAPGKGQADVAKLAEHIRGASELALELTVVLVTAPETRLSGTILDAEINAIYDANAEGLRVSRRPFITALRIQDRKLVAFSVSESAFSMSVPAMPESPLAPDQRAQLIADARQARLERERAATPAKTEPAKQTNLNVADEDRQGAIILRGQPREVTPKAPAPAAIESKPPAAPETAAATETPAVPPVAEEPKPAATEPVRAEPVAVQPIPEQPNPTRSPGPAVSAAESKPSEIAPPSVLPARVEDSDPSSGSGPALAVGVTNASPASPVAAVTAPARTWFTAGGLFVAGLCFFVVAALLSWVLLRRARTASGPSYITRSIDDRR